MTTKTQHHTSGLFNMVTWSIANAKLVARLTIIVTLVMCCFLPFAKIDVDPENMLSSDEPTRVFHNQMKQKMNINDLIVIGIENPNHPQGIFQPESLNRILAFSDFIKTVTWDDEDNPGKKAGVVTYNILTPNKVDAIDAGEPGVIRFERLMGAPIQTQEQAEIVKQRAMANPFLAGTMISNDQKSMALYIPITSKSVSADVYDKLNEKIETMQGEEIYHITGLPLAEDVFGIDMFIQMAISAPLAMIFIFILIMYFFRNAMVGASALVVAMVSVLVTMGAFVASGNTIHIMSSMIAIFLMPIAVLDAIHILSMFFDKYQQSKDRVKTLKEVMSSLFVPMLNTSLTSAAGFFSLYLAPIPPIQVFGIFVGFGILLAWFLSMTLIPAYIMLLKPERLENFGSEHDDMDQGMLTKLLQGINSFSYNWAKSLVLLIIVVVIASIYGIKQIKVNDNPMKWLHPTHPIRVADDFINHNFGGNYLVYLTLSPTETDDALVDTKATLTQTVAALEPSAELEQFKVQMDALTAAGLSKGEFIDGLWQFVNGKIAKAPQANESNMEDDLDDIFADDSAPAKALPWPALQMALSDLRSQQQVFKRPDVLNYIVKLQAHIEQMPLVGKSNSLPDLVKKLNKELHDSNPQSYRIPDTASGVSEALIAFENSHEPFRLWHAVTQDFTLTNMWFQVRSGDNQDINDVVAAIKQYINDNPPPIALEQNYFGKSYINTVWQAKMVAGMSDALIGSMVVVLVMMILLFRSIIWGLLSMIPLSVTIVMIYGVIGLMGKDYDMPVAVLSALALGLSVDFAIHFITHGKELVAEKGCWKLAMQSLFQDPARAIYRNIIIIAVGFTPLLLAALVPYQTVGMLMASIMLVSGFATLLILPAFFKLLERILFGKNQDLQPELSK